MLRISLILLVALLGVVSPAAAQYPVVAGDEDCSTPRRALLTWLANLPDDEEQHPEMAARCFDWEAVGIDSSQRQQEESHRLKQILDSRGLYISMDEVPDTENPENVDQFRPYPNNLEGFYLVRKDSNWVISAETIRHIPTWYDETFAFDIDGYLEAGPTWLSLSVFGVPLWQFLALLVLILLGLLLRFVVSFVVQKQGTRLLLRVVKKLDRALLERAASPIGTVVMALFLIYLFPALRFGVDFNRFVIFGLRVAAAVSGVLIVYRLVDVGADIFAKRAGETETKLDDQLVPLIRKSLKTITAVLGLIFVLQNIEVDVGSLIAGVSLGGLAFTLAARDTVANFFGSVSIFADQPFQVGDWVVMQGVEGVVEEVGMRSTRVRTFYNSLVSIPNSKVADGVIDNYGMRESRRTNIKLGLEYSTSPEQIQAFCDGVRAILANNPIVKKDSYHVYFTTFGDSGLEVMLYFFFVCETWEDELRQRHLIYLEILRLAQAIGVEFAFPTQTLHLASRAAETPVVPHVAPGDDALGMAVLDFGPNGALARAEGPNISHGFYPGWDAKKTKKGKKSNGGSNPDADVADSRE